MKRLGVVLTLMTLLFCGQAWAAPAGAPASDPRATTEAVLQQALDATKRGAFDEAVDALELLSDSGVVHPDVSYMRAFVYVERARSRARRPGDLGRAAAALSESELLRPDDDVERALVTLRSEISRLRAREGNAPVLQRPSLGRAVTGLLSENTWADAAALGSAVLTAGLVLYLAVKRRSAEIAGATSIVVGLVLGLIGASFALAARHYRMTSRPAVVVVPEARLLDESGRPLAVRSPNPSGVQEGALVYVHEQREGRARVEWGALDGWVDAAQLRVLATRASGSHD
jgi:hypothetical protein